MTSFKSLERVNKYPVVSDSLGLTIRYYQWLKGKSRLFELTLSKAETALIFLKDTTEPYVVQKLKFVDDVVYNQLERLEKFCPILLEPSTEITRYPERIYRQNIEPSVQRLLLPVKQTVDTVSHISTAAVSTVSSVVKCREPLNCFIDKTEIFLEKYLHEEDGVSFDNSNTCKESLSYSKIQRLSSKTRRLIIWKVTMEIDFLYVKDMEILVKLRQIFDDIQNRGDAMKSIISEEYGSKISAMMAGFIENSERIRQAIHYVEQLYSYILYGKQYCTKCIFNGTIDALQLLDYGLNHLKTIINQWSKPADVNHNYVKQITEVLDYIEKVIVCVTEKLKEYLKEYDEVLPDNLQFDSESIGMRSLPAQPDFNLISEGYAVENVEFETESSQSEDYQSADGCEGELYYDSDDEWN